MDRDVQSKFKNMAQRAAENFAKEMESASPRIRKAASGILDANSRVAASNKLLADSRRRAAEQSKTVADLEQRISDARRSGSSTARALASDESQLVKARRDLSAANRTFIRDTDEFERAVRRQHLALKALDDARSRRGGGGGAGRSGFGGGQGGNALGGIFTSIPFVPGGKAGAVIGSGLVAVLGSVAEAATTASQSLWLLPAAAAAGGAGFLTLKLGLEGFDKALKDMGDPKKFAQDLAGLAPNAQQAALEIQKLVSGLDGLKNVTQNALFRGVAQQLGGLGQAFMPQIKQMTTGIAGAFNAMFQQAAGQLRTPGTSAAISGMINNIVQAFHNLAPAMAPVVNAFAKIAKVGSDFLPGMATGIANLATKFADFITKAQESGKLHEWIQKGINAAAELGHVIGDIAHKIYDVFGNKSPEQFKSTLDGMVGAAVAVAQAIAGISQVVNGVINALRPVAQMLGGWPSLIRDVVAAWALWKVGALISQLGIVQGMLANELPSAAEKGAGRISAALAGIKAPAWIATFLALWNLHGDSGPGPNIPGGQPTGPGSPDAQAFQAKQNAGNAYAQEHGGQMPPGYMQWLRGGAQPPGMDKYYVPPAAPGTPFFDSQGRPLDAQGKPFGGDGSANPTPYAPGSKSYAPPKPFNKNSPGWFDPFWDPPSDIPVPGVPDKKGPKGKLPKVVTPFDQGFTAPPRPGESEGEYSAEGALMQAKHRQADDEATLLALKKDNNATAEQIQAQENKIAKDKREVYEAELRLQEAQDTATKKAIKGLGGMADSLKDIGPKLDEDFGLSQGLPGLAKNLVEFVATLAAAPLLGQLEAAKQANENAYGIKGGSGLLGIMGANNLAQGKSPLLGIPGGMPGGPVSGMSGGMAAKGGDPLANLNFDALAGAEAGGNWANKSNPKYRGGLQFDQQTWNSYRPPGAPDDPADASKDQQIQAAMNALRSGRQPQKLWPQNYGQLSAGPIGQGGGAQATDPEAAIRAGIVPQHPGIPTPGAGTSSYLGGSGGGGLFSLAGFGQSGGGLGLPGGAANALALAQGANGQQYKWGGAGDAMHQFLYDCSGFMSNIYNALTGQQLGVRRFTTESNFGGMGFQPGFDPNSFFNIGVSPSHMAGSLGGTNVESGGAADMTQFGGSAAGPLSPQFGQHWHLPNDLIAGGPGLGAPAGFPGVMGQGGGVSLAGWHDGMGPTGQSGGGPAFPGPPPSPGPGGGTPGFPGPQGPVGPNTDGGWQPQGGGGLGMGGLPASAAISAASAFPGGGAAAQLGIQLMNRTIQYGGELAGEAASGLMETFGLNDSALGKLGNNLPGRLLKGIMSAKPSTPTSAGQTKAPANDDQSQKGQSAQGAQGGKDSPFQLNIENYHAPNSSSPQSHINDLGYAMQTGQLSPLSVV